MLRLFTPGAQQAPAAAGDWDCILYIRDYAIGIQFQIPSHLPVADDLKMIDGNDGTQRGGELDLVVAGDRKSTRLNSSHSQISYAVFCLKKKKTDDIMINT